MLLFNHCEYVQHVKEVLEIFDREKLVVNLKKCEFAKRELEFLGFRISAAGILPSLSKTKAIQDWKRPSNVQEVRQFLGLAQQYRRFCPNFSTVPAPLTELTHGIGAKKRAIIWNNDAEKSLLAIKRMLTSPPLGLIVGTYHVRIACFSYSASGFFIEDSDVFKLETSYNY